MDDPDYVENMVSRATKYSLAGITAGTLFYTFETSKSPFDVRVIDKLIKTSFV